MSFDVARVAHNIVNQVAHGGSQIDEALVSEYVATARDADAPLQARVDAVANAVHAAGILELVGANVATEDDVTKLLSDKYGTLDAARAVEQLSSDATAAASELQSALAEEIAATTTPLVAVPA